MMAAFALISAMTLTLLSAMAPQAYAQDGQRNTCAACHTTANRLIAITQQLAKGRLPAAAPLSEGEG